MAGENPTWGYTRIQGARKNLGHQIGRSTVARILKATVCDPRRTPDVVADVSTSTLRRDRRCRFFATERLDVDRSRHVLHGLRHRSGDSPRTHTGHHATSERSVY